MKPEEPTLGFWARCTAFRPSRRFFMSAGSASHASRVLANSVSPSGLPSAARGISTEYRMEMRLGVRV